MRGWKARRLLLAGLVAGFLAGLLAGLAAALLATPAAAQDATRISAVATFSILGDLVKNVGGNRVDVVTLVGPDGDAHVYSPTPGDAKKLAAAKIVFVNGLGLEGWMTRLVHASGTKPPLVTVTNGITPRKMEDESEPGRLVIDPHAWQSVVNAKAYVANIRDGLTAIDPAGKAIYDANAAAYLGKLDQLDNEVHEAIAAIPADRRRVITTHDSLGYFGDAYGLKFISPERVSTDSEASARDVAKIIAQMRREKIPAVFMENITDPRLMREIARETGAAMGGTLYSDALSAPGGPAASYLEMMRHNVRELTKALAG
jgi:zinc/manganese transport system substrate-binding protein